YLLTTSPAVLLFCQRRLSVSNAPGTFSDAAFEAACLDRNIFREEARKDRTARSVAGAKRCKRLFGQHAAAGRIAEQPQIGCSPGKRCIGSLLCEQPPAPAPKAVDRFPQAGGCFFQIGRVRSPPRAHRSS